MPTRGSAHPCPKSMLFPTILLAALPLAAGPTGAPCPVVVTPAQDDTKQEYEKRREEAKGDVEKLWSLADWCEANGLSKEMRSCLRAVLKIDDGDRKAHELLGHLHHDGRWFTTQKKLDTYKKKEEERIAKENGWVRYKGGWADPADIPHLEKGLTKTATGEWVDAEMLKRIEEGWQQQDLTWISPEELEKAEAGLWKCGEAWLSLEDANAYHSKLGKWWVIPSDHFLLNTTLPREVAMKAQAEAERTFSDLVRIFGIVPAKPIAVCVLNSGEQYNRFSAGDKDWPGTDAAGLSSIHGAFFADGLIDYDARKWMGMGVGYWDWRSDTGNSWGRTFTRHAAGQSFAEFVDPSPKTVAKFEASKQSQLAVSDFYAEKKLPSWYRYGAATYVERYYIDAFVDAGGDPHWARKWSIGNIARAGGLDPLDAIFDLAVSADKPDQSAKLINETGLLMAFMLDGDSKKVKEAHAALKAAFKSDKGINKAVSGLQKALEAELDELRMFADL